MLNALHIKITIAALFAIVACLPEISSADDLDAAVPVDELHEQNDFAPERLIGANLRNQENEDLGTLSGIVMAPETGEPAVAIVSRAGLFGVGEQEVAVPWQLLRVVPTREDVVVLDATDEVLEAAPEPDADLLAIPEMFEEHWHVIEDYWAAQQQQ